MDPLRFIPRLEEIEGRITPSVSPAEAFAAGWLAEAYAHGTHSALAVQGYLNLPANQQPVQTIANSIIAQAPTLAQTLEQYVSQLQAERAATTDPMFAQFLNGQIARYSNLAYQAQVAQFQAQRVGLIINSFLTAENNNPAGSGGFNFFGGQNTTNTTNTGTTNTPGTTTTNRPPTTTDNTPQTGSSGTQTGQTPGTTTGIGNTGTDTPTGTTGTSTGRT